MESYLNIGVVTSCALILLCTFFTASLAQNVMQVNYDANSIILNGQKRLIFSGSIHYPRSTVEMWPDLIRKAKEGGINTIETYIFWDRHEPEKRKYDFTGNLDFVKFFKLVQEAGLFGIIRIGPYVCAEWNYGGYPVWLHNLPGVEFRTDNKVYKDEMQIFTSKIVNMCNEAKLFAPQGGPIIFAQIENEYGNVMSKYGEAGKAYIKWCAEMALAQNVGVPWIMCQQSDAPQSMINTCNGYYCDTFKPNNASKPKMWTENWSGWFKVWGQPDPFRTPEDLAFSVARFFQAGGVLVNYYMYHGGTNFGRTSGGPYIVTSYDYNAPLDEYGNYNQPKWGHLKELHELLRSGEKIITSGQSTNKDLGNGVTLTTYEQKETGGKFCFLGNPDNQKDANVELQPGGPKYFVPAWSVSILPGCVKEVYNTAKVNAQTSVMVHKPDQNARLSAWAWSHEPIKNALKGIGTFSLNKLIDHKEATVDASDYLWYMTSFNVTDKHTWKSAILRVKTNGHGLHVYVNKKLVGRQWGTYNNLGFEFEVPVSLKTGNNVLSLLSVTVGLKNYGEFFDLAPTGIVDGPVMLIGSENVTMDLTKNRWSYKVGLDGLISRYYDVVSLRKWSQDVETNRPLTWYKSTFPSPAGTDPVVLDLDGMGKGEAWVNGRSIGRYWPSVLSTNDGCSPTCDYRGQYSDKKCSRNCGAPSQRWYHVPRSFLKNDTNILVLFEENGGGPSKVSVQTVTIGTACGNAYDGRNLELSCQGGQKISSIKFASFGDPQGSCGSFTKGSCEAPNTFNAVKNACVGKERCQLAVSETTFGASNCGNKEKRLVVEAVC